jgi:hypothetical protein
MLIYRGRLSKSWLGLWVIGRAAVVGHMSTNTNELLSLATDQFLTNHFAGVSRISLGELAEVWDRT